MKTRMVAVLLTVCMLLCAGCGAAETPLRISGAGDMWVMGFGCAEIAVPETAQPLYIAGYHGGEEIEGILDLPCANAVWMETAESAMLLIGIDCIGLGADMVALIREWLAPFAEETGCGAIAVYATHTHAGIDTLGLWGPTAQDGKNLQYTGNLLAAAADAAQRAYDARKTGTLYFSQTETEGLQEDSRAPYVYDPNLYQLHFQPDDPTQHGMRIVFFAAHAESLRGDNRLLSRDFPGVMADTIRAETGDDTLFVPGAIGGLIMTPVLCDGDAETDADFYIENCRRTGEALAAAALSVTEETLLSPSLAYAETTFSVPLDNTLFLYYKFLGILGNPITDGADSETGYALTSTCAALQLGGAVTVALLPGEVFPELVYTDGDFRMAGGEYQLLETTFPSLSRLAEQYHCGTLLICGLANDELGYILPPEDYMVNPDLPYFDGITDESGENHYEETNSAGIRTAQSLFSAMETVFAALECVRLSLDNPCAK